MKTILAIKMFLVLCCYQEKEGVYVYEVKEIGKEKVTGTLYHTQKYSEGDTIRFSYSFQPPAEKPK